jgi:hypothetical protein
MGEVDLVGVSSMQVLLDAREGVDVLSGRGCQALA